MDPLVANDIALGRQASPAEKLAQALELMEAGFRLKRVSLRSRHPEAAESAIDQAMEAWLTADD